MLIVIPSPLLLLVMGLDGRGGSDDNDVDDDVGFIYFNFIFVYRTVNAISLYLSKYRYF